MSSSNRSGNDEKRHRPSGTSWRTQSYTNLRLSSSSRPKTPKMLDKIDLQKLKNDFSSLQEISTNFQIGEAKSREDSKKNLAKFSDMVFLFRKLPTDISLSRVIKALQDLDQEEDAVKLFNLFKEKTNVSGVVGAWAHHAALNATYKKIKVQKNSSNINSDSVSKLLDDAKKIWHACCENKYLQSKDDNYLLSEDGNYLLNSMMSIYSACDKPEESKALFGIYKNEKWLWLSTHINYTLTLIDLGELEAAEKYTDTLIKIFQSRNDPDPMPMQNVFNNLIKKYLHLQNNDPLPKAALSLFGKAVDAGFYKNSRFRIRSDEKEIKIDFRWDNYKKIKANLTLEVAKVAFVYFMTKQPCPIPVETSKYGRTTQHNPLILTLSIPYPGGHKIESMQDVLKYLNLEQIRQYFADLKPYTETREHKDFPMSPEHHADKGSALFNRENLSAAIEEYKKAIDLIKPTDVANKQKLAELHRKIGLAYNRQDMRDSSIELSHYEKGAELDPDNIEIHYNWGMGLERCEKYEEAIKKFAMVINKNPVHDEACVHLGDCHTKLARPLRLRRVTDIPSAEENKQAEKQYEQAEKSYKEAIQRLTNNANKLKSQSPSWAYSRLGDLYLLRLKEEKQQGKNVSKNSLFFTLSKKAFETSTDFQSNRTDALRGLANLHNLVGDADEALKYTDRARIAESTRSKEYSPRLHKTYPPVIKHSSSSNTPQSPESGLEATVTKPTIHL